MNPSHAPTRPSPDPGPGARAIPRAPGLEHSLPFLRDPYRFIARQCRAVASDVVELRLMLQPTICLRGARAAELFYDQQRFVRAGAAPEPVRATLFGKGGVQGLDGAAHFARKRLFLVATSAERTAALLRQAEANWLVFGQEWERQGRFALYPAAQSWLARTVCEWAGVPWLAEDAALRTRQLSTLFDGAASSVGAHLRTRRARKEAEAWLVELIDAVRSGADPGPAGTVLECVAHWRGDDGAPLPSRIAAVELLNLLRPTVAVSVYVVFLAHALHLHPAWADRLRDGDPVQAEAFVQEVRRFYPFFPAVAARVATSFSWEGLHFPRGRRAMLDLYGTNHDPQRWDSPDAFRPERFLDQPVGRFDLVPQGGARAEDHHRCPGEDITVRLMKLSLRLLLQECSYRVPPQDLRIDMRRLPALPASRFLVEDFSPRKSPG